MKYAIIDKGNGRELLVSFQNIRERQEQEVRFGYEFPCGSFRAVDYPTARKAFGFRSTGEIKHPCELCDGKVFKAAMRAEDMFVLIFGQVDHKDRKGVI